MTFVAHCTFTGGRNKSGGGILTTPPQLEKCASLPDVLYARDEAQYRLPAVLMSTQPLSLDLDFTGVLPIPNTHI